MNISWDEISVDNSPYLDAVFDLYNQTFPYEVREPHQLLMKGFHISKNHYHLLIGLEDEKLVSFATVHYLAEVNTGFIVYIATNPSVRNKGIGSKTLAQIKKQLKLDAKICGNDSLRTIVLETEKLEFAQSYAEKEECLIRTRFFERNGFSKTTDIFYLQPPLHDGEKAVPLDLFTNKKLSKGELNKIIYSIYKEKYFKVNKIHRQILEKCLTEMDIKL